MTRYLLAFALVPCLQATVYAQDSDGDGISNGSDARPCDTNVSAVTFTPSETGLGTLSFEDQWPQTSDLDFNDVVIRYNLTVRRNAAGVRSIRLYLAPSALGGIFDNGLGWQLPVPASSATSVRRRVGSGAFQDLTPEGDSSLTVRLSGNLRELYGNQAGIINSAGTTLTGQALEVEITFANGTQLSGAGAPYDLFIFRSGDFGHQIHFPSYGGTAAMRGALFGTGNDGSTAERRFVYRDGTPFALNLQNTTVVPREGVAIQNLFPDIIQFAASAGATHTDFYQSQVVSAYGFSAANVSLPADTNDLSCLGPVGLSASNPGVNCYDVYLRNSTARSDGLYWVNFGRGARQLYCSMSSDGGGWTLVAQGHESSSGTANWNTRTGALNESVSAAVSQIFTGNRTWKLSDDDINALKTPGTGGRYRVQSVGWYTSRRFVPGSCVYTHNANGAATGCNQCYNDYNLTQPLSLGSTNPNHLGIGCADGTEFTAHAGAENYVLWSAYNPSAAPPLQYCDGQPGRHRTDIYASTTNCNLWLWVR